jgi:hypothetical protein
MEKNSTAMPESSMFDGAAWFDPIEAGLRDCIRGFIETMLEEELTTTPSAAIVTGRVIGNFWAHLGRLPSPCRGAGYRGPKAARRNGGAPHCPAMRG